jgi:hypothetical protein
MAKTFSTLQRDVASYVKLPTDTEALGIAGSGINDAINNVVNSRSWEWQKKTYNFALTANDNTYPVPTDFREPRNLSILNVAGEVAREVGYTDPKIHDRAFQRGTGDDIRTGIPTNYTIDDPYPSGIIRFDRTPDANTVSTYPSGALMYYGRVPELTSATDTMEVPPEVESLILWYAKSYVAAIFASDQVRYAENRWQPLYNQLKRDGRQSKDWRRRSRY